jgi:hypothetical protein
MEKMTPNPIIHEILFTSWIPTLSGDIASINPFIKITPEMNNISKFDDEIDHRTPCYAQVKMYTTTANNFCYLNKTDPNDDHDDEESYILYALLFDNGIANPPNKIILFLRSDMSKKFEFLSEIEIQAIENKGLIILKPINYANNININSNHKQKIIQENIHSHLTIAYSAIRLHYHKHTYHRGDSESKTDADSLTGISFNLVKKNALKEIADYFKAQIDAYHDSVVGLGLGEYPDKRDAILLLYQVRCTATGCFIYAKSFLHLYSNEFQDLSYVQHNLEIFNTALFSIRSLGEYLHDMHSEKLSENNGKLSEAIKEYSRNVDKLTKILVVLTIIIAIFTIIAVIESFL